MGVGDICCSRGLDECGRHVLLEGLVWGGRHALLKGLGWGWATCAAPGAWMGVGEGLGWGSVTCTAQGAWKGVGKLGCCYFPCFLIHKNVIIRAPTPEKRSLGFPTRSDTNRPVQSRKKVRILEFWVEVEVELYYSCSENKGMISCAVTAQLICVFDF